MNDSKTSSNADNTTEVTSAEPTTLAPDTPTDDASATDVAPAAPSNEAHAKAPKRKALVPGLYADEVVLPWESEDELVRSHAERKREFKPQGRVEHEAVLDVTYNIWLRQRKRCIEQIRRSQEPRPPEPSADETQRSKIFQKALSLSETIWRDLEILPGKVKGIKHLDAARHNLVQIHNLVSSIIDSLSNTNQSVSKSTVAIDVAFMERGISLNRVLDVSLANALSRLHTLQTAKQPKARASNSIEAESSAGSATPLAPEMPNSGDVKATSRNTGRKRARPSALGHDPRASEIVLSGESEDEFNRLHAELIEDLTPQGCTSKAIVFDMTCSRWWKYRFLRSETIRLNESLGAELPKSSKWPGILNAIAASVPQQRSKALSSVKDILNLLEDVAKKIAPLKGGKFLESSIEDARHELQQIRGIFDELIRHPDYATTSTDAMPANPLPSDFVAIEQSMKWIADIDASFDKNLSTLVALQRHKCSSTR
jgi:hypothetical protein